MPATIFCHNGVTACVSEAGEAVSGIVRERADGRGFTVEYPLADRTVEVTHHAGRFERPASGDQWHARLTALPRVTRRDYVHDGEQLLEWITPDEVVLEGGKQRWLNVKHFTRMRPEVPTGTLADLLDWAEPPEGVDPERVCYANEQLRFCGRHGAAHAYWRVVGDQEPRLRQGGVEVKLDGRIGLA